VETIILVGLNPERGEGRREVSREQGEALATEWEVSFFEVINRPEDVEEVCVTAVKLAKRRRATVKEAERTPQERGVKNFLRRLGRSSA